MRKSAFNIYLKKNKYKLIILFLALIGIFTLLYFAYSYSSDNNLFSNELDCDYTDVNKMYIVTNAKDCKMVAFGCDDKRRVRFDDDCGCGCEFKEWFKREEIDFE